MGRDIFIELNLNNVFNVGVVVGVDDVSVVDIDVDVAADGEVTLGAANATPDGRQDLTLLFDVFGVLDASGQGQDFRTVLDGDAALVAAATWNQTKHLFDLSPIQ